MATTARRWEAKVGELAVYPGHGVARIEALQIREIAGQKLEFLVLRKLDDESRILIPRDRIAEVGLRPPIERADAQRIWKILKERKRTKARSGIAWSRQFRELQEKLKLGTIFETAEVLRDLLRLQHTKELSFGERKLLENARSLLVQELAAAEATGTDEIEASIRAAVKQAPFARRRLIEEALPMAIYALLGSARVLSVSSTTTLAILTGMESEKRSADAGYDQLLGRERTPPK